MQHLLCCLHAENFLDSTPPPEGPYVEAPIDNYRCIEAPGVHSHTDTRHTVTDRRAGAGCLSRTDAWAGSVSVSPMQGRGLSPSRLGLSRGLSPQGLSPSRLWSVSVLSRSNTGADFLSQSRRVLFRRVSVMVSCRSGEVSQEALLRIPSPPSHSPRSTPHEEGEARGGYGCDLGQLATQCN